MLKLDDTWQSYMQHTTERIEAELVRTIDAIDGHPDLHEAMRYSLLGGGKRLRPLMVIAAAEALGGSAEQALPVACAVEMVHTYSLIHDDLPAMDDDDLRRGRPTNHKVFGEAMAILAGDALLTHAFGVIAGASQQGVFPAEQALCIVNELSLYAGANGMVGGQVADMIGEQGETTREQLDYIHTHKTGDLIVCSLRSGGHAVGASEHQLSALEQYGRKIGLAFQIHDDILDVIGDKEKLGKTNGKDAKMGKVTYPYFLGMEASKREVARLTQEARIAITDGSVEYPQRLLQLADFLLNRDH